MLIFKSKEAITAYSRNVEIHQILRVGNQLLSAYCSFHPFQPFAVLSWPCNGRYLGHLHRVLGKSFCKHDEGLRAFPLLGHRFFDKFRPVFHKFLTSRWSTHANGGSCWYLRGLLRVHNRKQLNNGRNRNSEVIWIMNFHWCIHEPLVWALCERNHTQLRAFWIRWLVFNMLQVLPQLTPTHLVAVCQT